MDQSGNELHIILGCFGRQDDGFISCAGVQNSILNVNPSLFKYNEIMDYLEICGLFDKPLFDYNSIRHLIFNLRDRYDQINKKIFSEKNFKLYEKFTVEHKNCGIYLKLSLIENYISNKIESKGILIPGNPSLDTREIVNKNNALILRRKNFQ